ncbi:SDR family oxidoreductase [Deinococcus roseus]|uniref:NAD(P)-dependent oxidoreductase n=1 Tax=Deinococcus roseus TaxID=392414 RepID=A0ABQ2D2L8_9DEIO|nr:SDR family oxidoreductase [Deinococcus roseus]GGJ40858.1 NAD(P)-dependent oxidoreductase [Deinococcus roseus]
MKRILVTGATGNVGEYVLRHLKARSYPFNAAVPDVEQAKAKMGPLFPFVEFDFERPETHAAALQDVDRLFLVRPAHLNNPRKEIFPFLHAAQEAGVKQVVFLSLIGAQHNPLSPHRKIEQHLEKMGMPYTFLRASFFMQNLTTFHKGEIEEGQLFIPAGQHHTALIDARDIAEVATVSLIQPGHEYKAYDLTGPEALDYQQVADVLSSTLGRRIQHIDPSFPEWVRHWKGRGASWEHIMTLTAIYTTARLGFGSKPREDLSNVLGRPAVSFERFAAEHRSSWAIKREGSLSAST